MYKNIEGHPAWKADAKYEPIRDNGQYGHLYGWPAPGDGSSQRVTDSFIIPNMFAKAIAGASTKDTMVWAEGELSAFTGAKRSSADSLIALRVILLSLSR